jgi:hypothetical protein
MRAQQTAWSHDEPPAPSRRRWLQFRFSTLMWFVAFTAVLSLWYSERDQLTKRMRKLEDQLVVHSAALGDDALAVDMSNPYGATAAWGGGGTMTQYGTGSPVVVMGQPGFPGMPGGGGTMPQVTSWTPVGAQSYAPTVFLGPNTGTISPPLGTLQPATPVLNDQAVRYQLYLLFTNHRAWLEKHCGQETAWQEFLKDPGVPLPVPAQSTSPAPGGGGDSRWNPPTLREPAAPSDAPPSAPPTLRDEPPAPGDALPSAPPTPRTKSAPPPVPLKLELYLPTVCKLLTLGETPGRAESASFLANIVPAAKDAAVPLAEAINDAEASVRHSAAYALQTLDTNAQTAAPRLKDLLASGRARDEILVARTLATIDPQSSAVTRLAELLQDQDANVRYGAAASLMALGPKRAAAAAPALEEALGDANQAVQIMAAQALSSVASPDEAKAILTRAVKQEKNPQVRRVMARLVMRLANGP